MAISANADPAVVSPTKIVFAWRPVWGWDFRKQCHRMIWLERVIRFTPLGMFHEYQTYAASEYEHHDKHGRYSWQSGDFY